MGGAAARFLRVRRRMQMKWEGLLLVFYACIPCTLYFYATIAEGCVRIDLHHKLGCGLVGVRLF